MSLLGGILVVLPMVGWLQTRRHLADILNELQRHLDLRQSLSFDVQRLVDEPSAFGVQRTQSGDRGSAFRARSAARSEFRSGESADKA